MTDARRRQRAPRRALKQQPSPAKCEIVHRRPMPDNAPVSLSDPFGPLRGRRDGSARDRPRSAHPRRERRWADAHVARKDLSLAPAGTPGGPTRGTLAERRCHLGFRARTESQADFRKA